MIFLLTRHIVLFVKFSENCRFADKEAVRCYIFRLWTRITNILTFLLKYLYIK